MLITQSLGAQIKGVGCHVTVNLIMVINGPLEYEKPKNFMEPLTQAQ
jgi:hypothetical protein